MHAPISNRLVVIVPVWNAEDRIGPCLRSILDQDVEDLGLIVRDDCSSDRTAEVVADTLRIDGVDTIHSARPGRTCLFMRNTSKLYAAGNIYRSVVELVASKHAVVATVDGDDRLETSSALRRMVKLYDADPATWMAWSQHTTASGAAGCSQPLPPPGELGVHRRYWAASHLRTARAWLYGKVRDRDLRDPRSPDRYMPFAGDAALLFPMMEMAGHAHCRFVDEALYHYNDDRADCEAHRNPQATGWYSRAIRERGARYDAL